MRSKRPALDTALVLLLVFVPLMALFQNCAQTPRVEIESAGFMNLSSSFLHSGLETECLSCHAKDRPAVMASGAPHDQTQDCIKCHTAGTAWAGQGLAKYDHTSLNPTDSCVSCHASARPTGLVGVVPNQFNHSAPEGQADCNACHYFNINKEMRAGVSWTDGFFTHAPTPNACGTCHVADRPGATTAVPANRSSNLFFHSSSFIGSRDCATCHAQNQADVGVRWSGGVFNHKDPLTGATVNTCQACHSNQRPTTLTASGFNHATQGQGDCVSCHRTGAGISWATAVYHAPGAPIPTSCNSCHANDRPSPVTLVPTSLAGRPINGFFHDSRYIGARDCATCHANNSTNRANVGKTFAGGFFDHKNPANLSVNINTCQACHSAQRTPGVPQGVSRFNHANGGMGDCVSCHLRPGVTFAGATFAHTPVPNECSSCHTGDRPASTVYMPSITSANRFRHLAENGGTGDCKKCHYTKASNMANIGVRWSGGDYTHMDLNGVIVKKCLDCHQIRGNQEHCRTRNIVTECYQCHNLSTQTAVGATPRMSWSEREVGSITCQ